MWLCRLSAPLKLNPYGAIQILLLLLLLFFSLIIFCLVIFLSPSVLWHCWLGGRKGIRPIETEWWGAGVVICLERCADLHMAQLMPLPLTVSCFSKIQICFTFLVLAYLGSPGQRAIKRVCVCVVVIFLNLGRSSQKPLGGRQKLILEIITLMVNHPSGSRQQSSRAAG